MRKNINVFKFGGASVKDIESIKNVGSIIQANKSAEKMLIVVSAMGKTTNKLEKVVAAYFKDQMESLNLLATVKEDHLAIANDLLNDPQNTLVKLNDLFVEVEWMLEEPVQNEYDFVYDQVICIGELASTTIINAYLQEIELSATWLDARDAIKTDRNFREAWVNWDKTIESAQRVTKPLFESAEIIVTQGFIGSTEDNETTTLGREGSDYTAAIFSFCLDAENMSIWKDVPGVLTADPRLFEHATLLDQLSYREAIEMTYYGAKVIHPKTIKPLQNKAIPLFVKSFLNPEGEGTMISGDIEDNYPPMIAIEKEQVLIQISTKDFSFVAEHHLSDLFLAIKKHKLQVNLMQNTAISFVVCVNDIDDRVEKFVESIEEAFKATILRDLELVTIRHSTPALLQRIKEGHISLVESRNPKTIQMVLKKVPTLKRK